MTAGVCQWEGCEAEVTGRRRCPEHQKEHRRKTDSERKQKARSADKQRPHLSASTPVSEAAKVEATKAEGQLRKAAVDALKRNGLPDDLIERAATVPGTPFEHREAFARLPEGEIWRVNGTGIPIHAAHG